jgi:hypothetical protein
MKNYTTPKGSLIRLGERFTYNRAEFVIERIYRNKYGTVKVESTNGVILDANKLERRERNV